MTFRPTFWTASLDSLIGQRNDMTLTFPFCSNIKSAAQVLPPGFTGMLLSFLPSCHSFERVAGYPTAMSCGCTVAHAENAGTVLDNLIEVHDGDGCSRDVRENLCGN